MVLCLIMPAVEVHSAGVMGEYREEKSEIRQRAILIDELRRQGISDSAVIDAMDRTPRHLFVSPDLRGSAYRNAPLPIGHDQTISQPFIVAVMTQLTIEGRRRPDEMTVLEIGTGSGYQAAVVARIVRKVYTIELIPDLANSAGERLKKLGYRNVIVRTGDGYKGWPEKAPFDAILVTAAPPAIPDELNRQLKPGGRMVIPVGADPESQELLIVDKNDSGVLSIRSVLPVRFVPMVPKGAGY